MEEKNSSHDNKKEEGSLEKQSLVLIAVLILLFATFLATYKLTRPEKEFTYEGINVLKQKVEGISVIFYVIPLSINGVQSELVLRNDPRELKNISITADRLLSGTKAWITAEPLETGGDDIAIAKNEIGMFTTKIGIDTGFGLTEVPEGSSYPQIVCENSTKDTRVFLMQLANETRVYEEGDCIKIEGMSTNEIIRATDALLFHWLISLKKAE